MAKDSLINLIKLVLAVLLLPVVWACGAGFHEHVMAFPRGYGEFFFWGMFGFVMFSLFFYQFWGVYDLGQKVACGAFQFMAPMNRFIASIVPFYLTAVILLFYVMVHFLDVKNYDHYFMFFAGFAFTIHIVLTAQGLQEHEKAFIKPEYLFTMAVVFILVVFVTVLLFNLAFEEFTFPEFFLSVMEDAWDIYCLTGKKVLFFR